MTSCGLPGGHDSEKIQNLHTCGISIASELLEAAIIQSLPHSLLSSIV